MISADFLVVGGGLVGLATAYQFQQQFPQKKVVLLEKEGAVAQHQSARSTGVLNSGVYTPPNSLKAYHTRYGKGMLRDFCQREGLPFNERGRLILATGGDDLLPLQTLQKQAIANGVDCQLLSPNEFRDIEPYASGIGALHIPETATVNFMAIADRLEQKVLGAEGTIHTNAKVHHMQEIGTGVAVQTEDETYVAPFAVNATGLYADRLAKAAGIDLDVELVPFRGEYYRLRQSANYLVNHLICPVPDLSMPFSGIYFMRELSGSVLCGPNAILAASREGYRKGKLSARTALKHLQSQAVRRLTQRHFQTALWEIRRSFSKSLFTTTLQRMVPSLLPDDLEKVPGSVRVEAITPNGEFVNDFVLVESDRIIHALNVSYPGATACLSIGRTLVQTLTERNPQ